MTYNLLSTTRQVVWSLKALNEDGSLYQDVSAYLIRADLTFSDQLESHKATFTLANPQAYFDIFGTGGGSAAFTLNRIIQFEKGFYDPGTETTTLYPAFYGRVSSVDWAYDRAKDTQIQVTVFDPLYKLLNQVVTTLPWYNQQVDLIASTLIQRYGNLTSTDFYPLDAVLPFVQFPSFTVADALKDLYDPWLYLVWFNYSGALATRPRVGSAASGSPDLVGYPDATAPPASGLVSFVFPDATLLTTHQLGQRLFTFDNQVRVLGQSLDETITYGPVQQFTNIGDVADTNFLPPGQGKNYNIPLSQQTNNQNILTARGVYVLVYDPSFNGPYLPGYNANRDPNSTGPYKTLCADPYAVTPDGSPVPLGPYESWAQDQNTTNPQQPSICSVKSDGRPEGMFYLQAVPSVSSWLSVPLFLYANADGGGYDYAIEIWGQPVVLSNAVLTKIIDYNTTTLTQCAASNIFSDNRTYQALDPADPSGNTTIQPLAMGTPLEIYVNPASLPSSTLAASVSAGATAISVAGGSWSTPPSPVAGGISGANTIVIRDGANTEYNVISAVGGTTLTLQNPLQYAHAFGAAVEGITALLTADGLNVSPYVKADWEQGRVVFNDMTYKIYVEDDDASHPYSTGGQSFSVTTDFDLSLALNPCLLEVYQTFRSIAAGHTGSFTYSIAGLTVGYAYQLRLHFADPYAVASNYRQFTILLNGIAIETNFDIWAEAGGSYIAVIKTYNGVVSDNTGTLTLEFVNGGSYGGEQSPIINAIELIDPQGVGGALPVINCGGPAINPTPPTVTLNSAYSENQRQYGIRNLELNNPLLSTIEQCTDTGQWYLNMSAWQRYPIVVTTASIPTIEPGQIVQYYNPLLGPAGSDQWVYIQQINRVTERQGASNVTDIDKYTCFLLYSQQRA